MAEPGSPAAVLIVGGCVAALGTPMGLRGRVRITDLEVLLESDDAVPVGG